MRHSSCASGRGTRPRDLRINPIMTLDSDLAPGRKISFDLEHFEHFIFFFFFWAVGGFKRSSSYIYSGCSLSCRCPATKTRKPHVTSSRSMATWLFLDTGKWQLQGDTVRPHPLKKKKKRRKEVEIPSLQCPHPCFHNAVSCHISHTHAWWCVEAFVTYLHRCCVPGH